MTAEATNAALALPEPAPGTPSVGQAPDAPVTALARKPRARLVEKGEWNHAIVVLGIPGSGKSTYALQRALELGGTPAYVIAHDPGWRLPAKLPHGGIAPLTRHDSVASVARALQNTPGGCHAVAVADGEEVLRFGVAVAAASLQQNGGARGVPVVVLLDEGVATGAASPYRLGDALREGMALRRHQHTAIIITAQDPRLIHYAMVGLATELVVFQLNDEAALGALSRMGMPAEAVARVRSLPKYEFIVHKLG